MAVNVSTRINVKTLYRVTVSTAVIEDNQILLIKEGKGSDRKQWNLPGGKVKAGEDLVAAAAREALEETGYEVAIRSFAGLYCYDTPTVQRMRLVFYADVVGGQAEYDDDEILDVRWFTLNQLNKMSNKHLSKAPLFRCILKDLQARTSAPLEMIRHLNFEGTTA